MTLNLAHPLSPTEGEPPTGTATTLSPTGGATMRQMVARGEGEKVVRFLRRAPRAVRIAVR